MSLKDLLKKYLYKAHCEYCGSNLTRTKVFCSQCQSDFYYEFSQNQDLVKKEETGYALLIDQLPYFRILIQKAQNPRNAFLIDGIACIIIVLIHAQNLPWPKELTETDFFEDKKLNHLFFKKLSKLLNRPLESKEEGRKGLFLTV